MLYCVVVMFAALLGCVATGTPIYWGLALGWGIFAWYAQRSLGWRRVFGASAAGLRTAWVVIKTLTLIGVLIGVWMASGTIATIVSVVFELVTPQTFVVMAFVSCAVVSLIIGTSFGTLSVVGVPLMIVARSGHINVDLVAGAIIAGIYVGDRCSPLSSSANLVAAVTHTSLYHNVSQMWRSGWVPLGLSVAGYAWLAWRYPLAKLDMGVLSGLQQQFTLAWWQLLPALIVIVMALMRLPISRAIVVSSVVALGLGYCGQHTSLRVMLEAAIMGFHPAQGVVAGGGIASMLTAIIVVAISCALAGVLNATSGLQQLQQRLVVKAEAPRHRFARQLVISIMAAGFGCNQSVAVILSHTLMQANYQDRKQLAQDIENTGIVVAPLVPWNIAVFVPTTVLAVSFAGYIPYALFLWLLPLWSWWRAR